MDYEKKYPITQMFLKDRILRRKWYFAGMRITFLLIAICLVSCNKEKLELEEDSPLIGEFEWTYSEEIVPNSSTTGPEMIDVTGTQDRYGLRIKKNGKAWLFRNGKVEIAGFIKQEYDIFDNTPVNVIKEKNGDRTFELETFKTEFSVIGYPFENYHNIYRK